MTTREERIAQTFVELADTVVAEFDVIDFLHTLTDRIVELLDVDAVVIMLADERGRPHPMASSSEQARLIELYTAQNGEGPLAWTASGLDGRSAARTCRRCAPHGRLSPRVLKSLASSPLKPSPCACAIRPSGP